MVTKMNIIDFVKVEFMAELLYWITLDCTVVPNGVATQCICYTNRHTINGITEAYISINGLFIYADSNKIKYQLLPF